VYINGKIRPGMEGEGIKRNDGGDKFKYDIL
jgi:hypothetical protein